MYKPGKNLLTILFAAGTLMFNSALPANALEYKLPDESVEKIIINQTLIINQTFNNRHLEDTCITEFYKDGSIVTKMDENSDNKIEWEKKEKQLDDKTWVTTYTTRGRFSGTSVKNKSEDGTIRINFLNKKGKLTDYSIEKTDDKGKKIKDFYSVNGTLEILEKRETEWMRGDAAKAWESGDTQQIMNVGTDALILAGEAYLSEQPGIGDAVILMQTIKYLEDPKAFYKGELDISLFKAAFKGDEIDEEEINGKTANNIEQILRFTDVGFYLTLAKTIGVSDSDKRDSKEGKKSTKSIDYSSTYWQTKLKEQDQSKNAKDKERRRRR